MRTIGKQRITSNALGNPGGKVAHILLGACFMFLATVVLAAPDERVTLQLKWRHQFQFAGYYAALEKGYYRDHGLDVELREAAPETDVVDEVTSSLSDWRWTDGG